MMSNLVLNQQEYKEILSTLNITIGYIDKIASGFYGIEETALALLLGFRENKDSEPISSYKIHLQIAMEKQFSNEEYDEIMEQEVRHGGHLIIARRGIAINVRKVILHYS